MPISSRHVFAEVDAERERQEAKWGEQNHSLPVWLAILGEEYGEVCQGVLKGRAAAFPTSPDYSGKTPDEWLADIRGELIQTATVAVQIVEYIDRTHANVALDTQSSADMQRDQEARILVLRLAVHLQGVLRRGRGEHDRRMRAQEFLSAQWGPIHRGEDK